MRAPATGEGVCVGDLRCPLHTPRLHTRQCRHQCWMMCNHYQGKLATLWALTPALAHARPAGARRQRRGHAGVPALLRHIIPGALRCVCCCMLQLAVHWLRLAACGFGFTRLALLLGHHAWLHTAGTAAWASSMRQSIGSTRLALLRGPATTAGARGARAAVGVAGQRGGPLRGACACACMRAYVCGISCAGGGAAAAAGSTQPQQRSQAARVCVPRAPPGLCRRAHGPRAAARAGGRWPGVVHVPALVRRVPSLP